MCIPSCGTSIMQHIDNAWHPIALFSKNFSPAQCKYSTFSREPLGLYLAVKHFRHYFEENPDMIMYCDHKPLVKAFYSSDNAREYLHLSEIPSFCTNLRFKGCDNVVADALSRIEINSIFQHAAKIHWHAFAKAQRNDYELKRYLDKTNSANVIEHEWNGASLLCDVSRDGTPRPLVPCGVCCIVFDNCHNLAHCGIRATIKFSSETYTSPNLKKDCIVCVQSCVPCQQTKDRPYTKSAYQHYPLTSECLSEIHVDLIGPLPESDGNRYVLMCVERFTRWFTATPLLRQDIHTVISGFLRDWVANCGAPLKCVTD